MSEQPLVSVVLPTFNRAHVLPRALNSVLAQTHRNLEVIVVDDGSTDQTAAVVRQFDDPRVRYLPRPNGGAGAARNTGIAAARGDLVAFLDSDDEWLREKLAKQVAMLSGAPADVGVVVCGHREYRPEKVTELTVDEFLARGDAAGSLLTGLWYVPPTWLLRKPVLDLAGAFDESLPSCEDWDLAFRLSDICRFAYVPEVLLLKHHTRGSVYDHSPSRIEGFHVVLERHRHRWARSRYWLARQEFVLGYWLLTEAKRRVEGIRYLGLAFWHHPLGQAKTALPQILWWLLPGRIRNRLWRYRRVREILIIRSVPGPRFIAKPVARIFTPTPLDPNFPNGFSARWFHFLQALSEQFELEVVAVRGAWGLGDIEPGAMRPPMPLRSFCVLDAITYPRWWPLWLYVLVHSLAQLNTRRFGPRIRGVQAVVEPKPDFAVFLTHFLAHLAFRLPNSVPCVFVLEEGLVRMTQANTPILATRVFQRKIWRAFKQWLSIRRYRRFIPRCGRRGTVVAISEEERQWFSQWIPARQIKTINLGLDPAAYTPVACAADCDVGIFGDLGQVRNYAPVLDLITRAQRRDDSRHLRWLLVGRQPAPDLQRLPAEKVTLAGNVEDTRDYYPRVRVVVVPAKIVTGAKTTLLKAWAMARPVVATSASAAGIPARHGQNLLIADGEDALLSAIHRLLADPALASAIGNEGRRTLEIECDQNRQAQEFADLCASAFRESAR